MKDLRFWATTLSIWLIFFFNIERLFINIEGFVKTDVNIIQSSTYVFVALILVATLLLPKLRGIAFSVLVVISIALFLVFWMNHPIWKKPLSFNQDQVIAITLLTIVQISAIALTGLLARQINMSLREFEGAVASIIFGQIGKPPKTFSDEHPIMYRELKRARRYQRPLSVIALKVDEEAINTALPKITAEVQQAMMKHYVLAGMARILDKELHDFNSIALRDDCFIVALPEIVSQEASEVARQLEQSIRNSLDVELKVGVANFPDQAETFESLIESAVAQTVQSHQPTAKLSGVNHTNGVAKVLPVGEQNEQHTLTHKL